ncbi:MULTISPECIES: TlpA family protein disulfide reductase [Chryseobacterium]|uniref:Cytochrome c biogenesis protein CcmG/thiol:disulfide interchange protein DsbE n=1 Tax=Chryseobacterium camelliae TaxID=1265445 RepID=A0ABU0TNV8_9FLAO|nr:MULTISPECIES: TlpA disulfide reductase family protein [Chryseobacterium]MDQ1098725.1 cytochrome c biogenesis protein CcmG/thiol:disulfide interchange protein DsbE [Chryseobacterium camelliae]MDR6086080.1 cytochrome c biogenesis protein CcmG/thiol:disulfide interchange protein DsbE [Chryseobacterium sp. SORGH_AS_0909]MDR6130449.1 cytochrome c biogenesis protein CcmG/thiol:disulfide interchange protein DsbE [Chryseobacterium sp. SORGH_AS_1175]MDT3407425.1 cytochrome c biogenesis protein CcmG/t
MKNIFSLFFTLSIILVFSQNKYYRIAGNKIFDEKGYKNFKDSISIKGKLTESIALVFKKNDSTFVLPRLEIKSANTSGYFFDYQTYSEQTFKKKVDFTNLKSIRSNKNIDHSKPYFVNCWFINCSPCVAEIPDLNKLQEEYKNKINFIAITFDNENLVKRFLEKTPFNFINLSNQKDLLHKMEVFSYPTSFILDKDGNFISFVPVGNEMYTKKILEKLIAN